MTLSECFVVIAAHDGMKTLTLGAKAVFGRSKEGYHVMVIARKEGFMELWIDACRAGIYSDVNSLIQRIKDEGLGRFWIDPES